MFPGTPGEIVPKVSTFIEFPSPITSTRTCEIVLSMSASAKHLFRVGSSSTLRVRSWVAAAERERELYGIFNFPLSITNCYTARTFVKR